MHPVLFTIFSFPIHSYGVMLAISFLLGIWLTTVRAKKAGLDPTIIADAGFWIIISAIVGSRLYYVILHFEEFRGNLLSIINPFNNGVVGIGGLVMYGGFIGAIAASIVFFRMKKLRFLPYADAFAPGVALGVAITRIGCFLNGCCFGRAGHFCAVSYPENSPAGFYQHHEAHAAGLLPAQIFESVGGIIIALIILYVGRRRLAAGIQFFLVGMLYAVLRFLVDFSRVYMANERLAGLSHNQVICIVLFIIFGGLSLRAIISEREESLHKP